MIITNIESVPGKEILEHFGLVTGSTVKAKNAGSDFMAGLKNFTGGELKQYTDLLNSSREDATKRMVKEAESMEANAIINVRYSTSAVAAGAAEIYVYGTAVKVSE